MRALLLGVLLLATSSAFAQGNKYWVKFKHKFDPQYQVSNPQNFLSQKSIERRAKQGIAVNVSDLPITQEYIDGITPYINTLHHRLKWFNMVVVDMDNAITLRTDTTAWRDTVYTTDTFSKTIYDSIFIHHRVFFRNDTLYNYDTISNKMVIINDTFVHPGPVYVRDTIVYTDVVAGNNLDSIRALWFVDSIGPIFRNPLKSTLAKNKFEGEAGKPVNQQISYPSKYGAAYHQINMLNGDLLHQMGYTGKGITVSVMDNGFGTANTLTAFDSVRPQILGTWDFVNNEQSVFNDGTHGLNVFSCMAANKPDSYIGTAPGADYYLLVTEDDADEWVMEEYNWAAAAEFADSAGAQIFSTSLGYTTFTGGLGSHTYADMTGHSTVITQAANKAFGKGILVINSAGNEGTSNWHYIAAPADGDSVMAIGAVDSTRKVVGFSSRGPTYEGIIKPAVCAQGSGIYVLNTSGGINTSQGTSFSCPITAGCAASLWSAFPDKSARDIYDAIVISADSFWYPDNNHGYGIPNFYNAYLFLKTNYNSGVLRISDNAVVYPNPFTSELNVSLFNQTLGEHRIELFDLMGRRVYDYKFWVRNETFEIITIDGSVLSTGEYILRIDGEKAARHMLKVR